MVMLYMATAVSQYHASLAEKKKEIMWDSIEAFISLPDKFED